MPPELKRPKRFDKNVNLFGISEKPSNVSEGACLGKGGSAASAAKA
jgi:hypothetical protein